MKTVIALTILLLSIHLSAKTTTQTSGTGQRSGWCDGYEGQHCARRLEARAEQEAISWAVFYCSVELRGPIEPRCKNECNPSYFPPNGPAQYVICRSHCEIDCEKRDPQN